MTTGAAVSGIDLRVQRVRARLTAAQVADAMGVTRARVTHLESLASVTDAAAHRYAGAVEKASADSHRPDSEVVRHLQGAQARALLERFGG